MYILSWTFIFSVVRFIFFLSVVRFLTEFLARSCDCNQPWAKYDRQYYNNSCCELGFHWTFLLNRNPLNYLFWLFSNLHIFYILYFVLQQFSVNSIGFKLRNFTFTPPPPTSDNTHNDYCHGHSQSFAKMWMSLVELLIFFYDWNIVYVLLYCNSIVKLIIADYKCMRVMHLLSPGQYIAHLYKTNIKRFFSFFNPFYILTYWPLAQSCRIFRNDYEIIPPFM